MDILAKRLRERRTELGLTQLKIADRVGIDRTTYCRYERGCVDPSLDVLRSLAQVLDCSADWLLGVE